MVKVAEKSYFVEEQIPLCLSCFILYLPFFVVSFDFGFKRFVFVNDFRQSFH